MTPLVQQVQRKQERLSRLLAEAWAIEAELNALHQVMAVPPKAQPKQRLRPRPTSRTRPVVFASDVDRRIRLALLTGPLSKKHDAAPFSILLERCEDIKGATKPVVAQVIEGLIAARMVAHDGDASYWRTV